MSFDSPHSFAARTRRCAARVTVGTLVVVGAFAGATATAAAAPQPGGAHVTASDVTTVVTAPLSPSARRSGVSASAAATYWTAERIRHAVPVADPKVAVAPMSSSTEIRRAPTGLAGSTAAAAPLSPKAFGRAPAAGPRIRALTVNASSTVGRVFFHDPSDGLDHSCSGSALNSASKRLVITAGHCVHGGAGRSYMQNWVFVPRYNNGARPFGTFSARTFRTFNEWTGSGSRDHDIAMVTTWNNERNQTLVNTVGGNGLSWNYPRDVFLTILGYPADPPYDGTWQQYCQGTTRRVGLFDGRIEMQCGFTGGSSGGPWLRAYDNASGLGNVDGVMSTLASNGWNRSSYFDDKVKSMLDATVND
jgi:V8-like Glu-specific endopeptidase